MHWYFSRTPARQAPPKRIHNRVVACPSCVVKKRLARQCRRKILRLRCIGLIEKAAARKAEQRFHCVDPNMVTPTGSRGYGMPVVSHGLGMLVTSHGYGALVSSNGIQILMTSNGCVRLITHHIDGMPGHILSRLHSRYITWALGCPARSACFTTTTAWARPRGLPTTSTRASTPTVVSDVCFIPQRGWSVAL